MNVPKTRNLSLMSVPNKKWDFWIRLVAAIVSAIATSLGVSSCVGWMV
jgi:hypothetical protein